VGAVRSGRSQEGSLGYKRYRTKALKTVRLEPWYALMALGVGATAGYAFFTPEIARNE
jgi:hypothetical protein